MRTALAPALVAAAIALSGSAPFEPGAVSGTVTVDGARPAGAVVYLDPVGEAARATTGRTVVDQSRLRFEPEVVAVAPGATVVFHNSDPLLHNIFSPEDREPFDLGTYPEGESRTHRFETLGPHVILCNIHPEMEAWVFVTPAPYRTVVGDDGTFRFDVPPGRYRLGAWHRRGVTREREVTVRAGVETRIDLHLDRDAR